MIIVVIIAARKTNPPNAPNAIIAPKFKRALNASRLSPSTEIGTFTLGTSPCCIFELPAISLSCGRPATIIEGDDVVVSVVAFNVGLNVGLLGLLLDTFTISFVALIVVGGGLGVLVRVRTVVVARVNFGTSNGVVESVSSVITKL